MLAITRSQIEALGMSGQETFVRRAVAALRQAQPDHPRLANAAEASALVRRMIELGAAHGIGSELGVMRLLLLELRLGPDFVEGGRHPWAEIVLRAPHRSEATRLSLLEAHAAETAAASAF